MRILHVIPGIAARYGGTTTTVLPLVAEINRLPGVHAEIATTDADGPGRSLSTRDLPPDMPIHMFARTWSEQWKVSLGLRQWLRRHADDYDLIHIHAVWSYATAAAGGAARRARVRYVCCPQGMLSDYSWNHRGRWKKRLYWNLIERRTIDGAAGFHVTSQAEAAEVRAIRPDARTFVIPHGVDAAAFTHAADTLSFRRRCGSAAEGLPILLFLSRLHPKKAIVDRLLPAVAAMRSRCFLAIAGAPDPHAPEHAAEVERSIERLGLKDRVSMIGPVSGDERWAMFDGADLFVLPSHAENFGIVVAEAMARGCPVVVTDAVQSSEHVAAAGAGEVVPPDVAALAAALDRIISQPELRRNCGMAGRAYAEQHFRWDRIAQQVCQMYRDCLDGR